MSGSGGGGGGGGVYMFAYFAHSYIVIDPESSEMTVYQGCAYLLWSCCCTCFGALQWCVVGIMHKVELGAQAQVGS